MYSTTWIIKELENEKINKNTKFLVLFFLKLIEMMMPFFNQNWAGDGGRRWAGLRFLAG